MQWHIIGIKRRSPDKTKECDVELYLKNLLIGGIAFNLYTIKGLMDILIIRKIFSEEQSQCLINL